AGQQWIASLTLPDEATSIAAGSTGSPTFRSFTNLQEISGANIVELRAFAFKNNISLKSVNFPKATTFREWSLENTGLITVYLPAATTLSQGVFHKCTQIITVNLPEITTLPISAFQPYNTQLRTAILPKTKTIETNAFQNCPLTSITIPDGCTLVDDSIQGGFRAYYEGKGKAGGVYTYSQLGWTGPF
ncbi:MAG: leucine-rich repeat domain-containing protein, partial [Treponema sp.]|nr:leucine-rich repeat domain-containing protein [Treponema sp.]